MKGGEVPPCLCSLALVLRAEDAAAHLFELHAVAIVPSAGFEPATSSLEPSCTFPFVLQGQKTKSRRKPPRYAAVIRRLSVSKALHRHNQSNRNRETAQSGIFLTL